MTHRPLPPPRAGQRARRAAQPHRCGGFTLIEVLVALAIVAVALAAGIQASGSLANNALRLAEVSEAQWCADNQLTAIRLTTQYPDVGDGAFRCEQLGHVYLGTLVVRPTPNPNFRRVDARVANEQGQPLLNLSAIISRY